MPKPIKKRVHKKGIDERDVMSLYERLIDYYLENKKAVYRWAAIAVLLIAAAAAVVFYNRSLSEQAESLQYEGYKLYHNLYQGEEKKADEETLKEALARFEAAYQKKSSPITLLYIANTQFALGRNEEALKTLDEFTRKYPRNEELLPLAYYKIAAIQAKEGRREEALKTLDTLYGLKASPFLKDVALYESAALLEKMGRKEEALKRYEELVEKHPGSPYYQAALAKVKEEEKKKAEKKDDSGKGKPSGKKSK
ncbi:MAG TPA: tetratricopeptide repeat protein [Nitrospirae bacterium]|nr:tetratricopeptide repeat protein [Nitrospirota bacterium]